MRQKKKFFISTVDRMGLNDEEVYVEMVTSWERKGRQETQEEIAMNLLQRGMTISETVEITGLTVERVRELQAQGRS
jgi:predicted transposase YdaD